MKQIKKTKLALLPVELLFQSMGTNLIRGNLFIYLFIHLFIYLFILYLQLTNLQIQTDLILYTNKNSYLIIKKSY